jgi:hypothetical protein
VARATVLVAVCVAGAALAGCGTTGATGAGSRPVGTHAAKSTSITTAASRGAGTATTIAAGPPRRPHRHHRRPAPDPGRLPQTNQLPSSATAAFHAEMRALWNAVLSGHTSLGEPAFFPETAYAQLKAIGDATADWRYRLYADYDLDIQAAHGLLSAPSAATHLSGVTVPGQYAHWVNPGVCENQIGYYEVPNARMVYREHGVVRSFGIASMISWRGRWYVIHLGYEGKLSIGGRVDDPRIGPGVSVPSDAC